MVEIESEGISVIYITPKIEDLIPNKTLKCSELNCFKEFSNSANLQMHLIRHHQRKDLKSVNDELNTSNGFVNKLYFCPVQGCTYNESSSTKKHFINLKYLRQHYQKVHIEKIYKCSTCVKMFPTEGTKKAHELNCNQKYECFDCGWKYTSREALLTHAKRKNHKINIVKTKEIRSHASNGLRKLQPIKSDDRQNQNSSMLSITFLTKTEMKNKTIQTEPVMLLQSEECNNKKTKSSKRNQRSPNKSINPTKRTRHAQIQTNKNKSNKTDQEYTSSSKTSQTKEKFFGLDLYETTESEEQQIEERSNQDTNSLNPLNYVEHTVGNCFNQFEDSGFCNIETQTEFSDAFLDQMLYSNMHTQTCDEFLSELGLTDIQTQTNWTGIETDGNGYHQYNINHKHDAATSGPHDELLVSTETQTSFTQCLLECSKSCNNTGSVNSNSVNGITQHTQTLERLFDGQENDFITNFQSTHTQT